MSARIPSIICDCIDDDVKDLLKKGIDSEIERLGELVKEMKSSRGTWSRETTEQIDFLIIRVEDGRIPELKRLREEIRKTVECGGEEGKPKYISPQI